MGITVTAPPTAITNFDASVISGGELVDDTTYEFKIVAKNVAAYMTGTANYMTIPASGVETTDTVNKSIELNWDYKTGYNYYIIGWKRTGDTLWKTLNDGASAHNTMIATQQSECTFTFDDETEDTSGTNVLAHFQTDFDTQVPVDVDTGVGKIAISGAAGDLKVEDIMSGIESAGLSDHFNYDGTTIHSKLHLHIEASTTGSLDLQYMSLFFYQCTILNSSTSFTFNLNYSKIYVITYGWRFNSGNLNLSYAIVQAGGYGNIRGPRCNGRTHLNLLYSANLYMYVHSTSILTGIFVRGFQIQAYAGTTMEDAKVDSLRINSVNTSTKTTIKNVDITTWANVYNTDWDAFTPITDYEFRGIKTRSTGYDIQHLYNNNTISMYDFDGLAGYTLNSDWNKPRIYWTSGQSGATTYKFFRDLQLLIIDENGDIVPSASITVNDKDDNLLTSGNSDGNGKWNEDIQVCEVVHGGGGVYDNVWTLKTPFEIIVNKTGYVKLHLNTDYQKTIEIPVLLRTFSSLPAHKVTSTKIKRIKITP